MDFDFDSDHIALEAGLDQLLAKYRGSLPVGSAAALQEDPAIAATLREAGYFDIEREMGATGAVMLIEAVARLPYTLEVAASALVAPKLSKQALRGPIALSQGSLKTPTRFLAQAGTALIIDASQVRAMDMAGCKVESLTSQFAYPYGRCAAADTTAAPLLQGATAGQFLHWWQVGLAAEIVGAMQSAIDLTVEYVKNRRQFNRPLGSFQVIQHRLSECTVLHHAARLLTYKAAWSGEPSDAALAAAYAQDAAVRVVYETHQFHGAIGLTLEYLLHYWTNRLRRLQGELGGASQQGSRAAQILWAA